MIVDVKDNPCNAAMIIQSLPCVTAFIDKLNESLKQVEAQARLSATQRAWFVFVLMGIVVTKQINWAAFERRGLGVYGEEGLRWMFNKGQMAWSALLRCSVRIVLAHYGIKSGTLVLDDSDKQRSKVTKKIPGAHKVKDKKTGGYFNGQELVFLFMVSGVASFPIDFRFYVPDPKRSAWRRQVKLQKQQGIKPKGRLPCPAIDPNYPSKTDLALTMLDSFAQSFPEFQILGVLADALYGTASFMDQAAKVTRNAQVISQLRENQIIQSRGKNVSLKKYFARQPGVTTKLKIRGQQEQSVTVLAARIMVNSHGKKRMVVALRYEGESDYRYLVASNLSWRHTDVVQMYTLRWLIEVFFEDWKAHGGWDRMTKHQGEKGSTRGVILSLLFDHMLLLHPVQSARLKNKQPGLPVGCLVELLNVDALIKTVQNVVQADDPVVAFNSFADVMRLSLPERNSKKHLVGLDLGRQEATNSLQYRAAA